MGKLRVDVLELCQWFNHILHLGVTKFHHEAAMSGHERLKLVINDGCWFSGLHFLGEHCQQARNRHRLKIGLVELNVGICLHGTQQ